jgi:hypothetical protein
MGGGVNLERVFLQPGLEESYSNLLRDKLIDHLRVYFKKSHDLFTHVDGLFACHVMGWRRIPPNWVGGKLFPVNL